METMDLRNFRGLDIDETDCATTSNMPQNQFVRVITRALVAAAAYDQAMVLYCRTQFEAMGLSQNDPYRHEICKMLRGTTAFAVLWGVYLDSDVFRNAYRNETGRKPPAIRDRNTEPSPNLYADFAREMKAPTLQELHHKNITDALQQQTRKILLKAREVDLVKYKKIKANKVQVMGTEKLFDFFRECMSDKMDQQ